MYLNVRQEQFPPAQESGDAAGIYPDDSVLHAIFSIA
jgi:hypothetical protein